MQKLHYFLLLFSFLLCQCREKNPSPETAAVRSSAVVAMLYKDPLVKEWLGAPGKAYFECHFMMPLNMAEDVIVGMDIEYGEGNGQPPEFFENAQWASILGVTREGLILFNYGTQASLNGTPTDAANWTGIDLGTELLSETWYRLRTEVDYQERKYVSVTLEGANIDTVISLQDHRIEFTVSIPFDQRNLTFYVLALRNQDLAAGKEGNTYAYFDKVEGGIWLNQKWETVFQDGFENQSEFPDVPATLPTVKTADFQEGFWYPRK